MILALSFAVGSAWSEEFRNGSFELLNPDATNIESAIYGSVTSTQLLGWAISDGNNVGWRPGCYGRWSFYRPFDGAHHIILSGPATVSQTFSTRPAESYEVTFHVARFCGGEAPAFLAARVTNESGHPLAAYGGEAGVAEYRLSSFTFVADSTHSTLSFSHTNADFGCLGLDAVFVNPLGQLLSIGIQSYPVVEIRGEMGELYAIEFTETLGPGAVWKTLTTVIITATNPSLFVDTSRQSRQRFYRLKSLHCDQ